MLICDIFQMENYYSAYTVEGYTRILNTAAHGIFRQAFGSTTGLHQVFGQFSIEAVSMRPSPEDHGHRHGDLTSIVRYAFYFLFFNNCLISNFQLLTSYH